MKHPDTLDFRSKISQICQCRTRPFIVSFDQILQYTTKIFERGVIVMGGCTMVDFRSKDRRIQEYFGHIHLQSINLGSTKNEDAGQDPESGYGL